MNKTVKHLLLLSAIVPATFLVVMCVVVIVTLLGSLSVQGEAAAYLITSILGILGYIGLIKLLMSPLNKGDKAVLYCLLSGVASFVIFVGISGPRAWKWVLTLEEPGEWLVFVWPTMVSILFIVSMVKRLVWKTIKGDG